MAQYEKPEDQIEANRDHGDKPLANLFEYYTEHLDDWERGNSEYTTVTIRDDPLFILMKVVGQFKKAFKSSLGIIRGGYTEIRLGDELQPHFQHLEGLRLKQAVLFGTLWEKEVPHDRPDSPVHEEPE